MLDTLHCSSTFAINIFSLPSLLGHGVWISQLLSQSTSNFICRMATLCKYVVAHLCPEMLHVNMKYGWYCII